MNNEWIPLKQFDGAYSINGEGVVRKNACVEEHFYKSRRVPSQVMKEYISGKGRYVKIRYKGRPQKNFYIDALLESICNIN